MLTSLRDLVFTPTCIGCGELGLHLCPVCLTSCLPQESNDVPGVAKVVAASAYGGWLRDALVDYKNGSRRQVYGLAQVLQRAMLMHVDLDSATVVPMPSSPAKIAARGFDTISLLARECMKLQSPAYGEVTPVLYSSREVADQVGLSAKQREQNVARSMAARRAVTGTVLVVDDVVTTGSTMSEAARTLRLAGARNVFGISLCGSAKWA